MQSVFKASNVQTTSLTELRRKSIIEEHMQVKTDNGKDQPKDDEHAHHCDSGHFPEVQLLYSFVCMDPQCAKERHHHQEIEQDDAVSVQVHIVVRKTFIGSKAVVHPCE